MEVKMSLSCYCDYYYEFDPGNWTYFFPGNEDFVRLDTAQAKRCCSCGKLIKVGDICVKYQRYRYPYTEIESQIRCRRDLEDALNDEPDIRVADHYHCEWCGEMFMNLTALGYECLCPNEDMRGALKEYHELSGFNPQQGQPNAL
jgi:hypothetical protein